jgi:hypothetical protein
MYYETKVHQLIEVKSVSEAAAKIKSPDWSDYQAIAWPAKKENCTILAVCDGHVDNPKLELAILIKDNATERYTQIESITNGWIETAQELEQYLVHAEVDSPTAIEWAHASLIVDKPTGKEKAHFTCGCYGTGFNDNVKYQLTFDQDSGYGICKKCEQYYK